MTDDATSATRTNIVTMTVTRITAITMQMPRP